MEKLKCGDCPHRPKDPLPPEVLGDTDVPYYDCIWIGDMVSDGMTECHGRTRERELLEILQRCQTILRAVSVSGVYKELADESLKDISKVFVEESSAPSIEIPVNLEACFISIKEIMREGEINKFKEGSEKEATAFYHFGFGRWMRNNWGLWSGSKLKDWFVERGLHHADDMSGVILVSFWRHLNNKPIDLEGQIKHYQDYWKSVEKESEKK